MQKPKNALLLLAGACAGALTGLFGTGGGTVLVPMLEKSGIVEDKNVFCASVAIIAPLCVIGLITASAPLPGTEALLIYLPGSALGGLLSIKLMGKLPTLWLHRALGALLVWGGVRALWP